MKICKEWLYAPFRHWFRGGQIYFYSDPHFGDEEMAYLRKDYIGDEEQVKSINSRVGKNDTIVFLGDIGDETYISKIRGYKVLIKGNHDKGNSRYEGLFDEVYSGPLFISKKLLISHEPIKDLPFCFNLHGHDHACCEGPAVTDYSKNLCAELIGYKPFSLSDLIGNGTLSHIFNLHERELRNRRLR